MASYLNKNGGAELLWGAKRQSCVVLSTCETEYDANAEAAKYIFWSLQVFGKSGYRISYPIKLKSDNESSLGRATSEQSPSSCANHFYIHLHFIREEITRKGIVVSYVEYAMYDADILTKGLTIDVFKQALTRIDVGEVVEDES